MAENLINEQLSRGRQTPLAVATSATLTVAQLMSNRVIAPANGVAVTLPAPTGAELDGREWFVTCPGAAATVVVAAGFGGGGNDTLTLALGEYAKVLVIDEDWYCLHNEPAA